MVDGERFEERGLAGGQLAKQPLAAGPPAEREPGPGQRAGGQDAGERRTQEQRGGVRVEESRPAVVGAGTREPCGSRQPVRLSDLHPRLDPTPLAVARYPAGWSPPTLAGSFLAMVVEPAETTVVAAEDAIAELPSPEAVERGWQRVTLAGPLPWELVGFLADVASRLAAARIPFTSFSGFTTDHLLVRSAQAEVALAVLRGEPAPELRPNVINP